MSLKFNRMIILVVVMVTVLTLSFGLVANAEPQKIQSKEKAYQETFDRDRIRQQDKDCTLTVDCTQDQLRTRDRDCVEDCICDKLNIKDQLRLRIHDDKMLQEALLYQELKVKLEKAIGEEKKDTIEKILPEMEKVKSKLHAMVRAMNDELAKLKLQMKESIQSKFSNGQTNQFRERIRIIEDEIKVIEKILQ